MTNFIETLGFLVADIRHHSSSLNRDKNVRVAINSSANFSKNFNLVLLLHHFGGNRGSWITAILPKLNQSNKQCILVSPESGRNWFINDDRNKKYADYLLNELLGVVKDNLGVRIDGDIQLVAGFSMGGACALFHGVDRPEVFSHVYAYAGAFSASERIGDPYAQQRTIDMLIPTEKEHNRVWGMKNSEIRNRYSPETIVNTASVIRPMLPDIRIVVGRSDFTRILEMNRQMHDLLMEHDIEHEYFEVEGNHNMDFAAITLADWLNIILAPGD